MVWLIIIGVFLIVLGISIGKFTLVSLISGYDKERCSDPKGLAKYVGNELIVIGSGFIFFYFIDYVIGLSEDMLTLGILVLVGFVVIPGFTATKRYMKKMPGDKDL